ncbi:prepilin peptidase [Candidatus Uhrbacteria bacterium]|nr:prepilin peptidase [Candidatus Uhrbacteria bacterium]
MFPRELEWRGILEFMVTALSILGAGGVGAILGSFANVCIDRVPAGTSLRGRSQCDQCRKTLRWWELIPIVSAVFLRHRCPRCVHAFSLRNTTVEVMCAAIAIGAVASARSWSDAIALGIGGIALVILTWIDAERGVVPDLVSLPAIALVIALRVIGVWGAPDFLSSMASVVATGALGAGWFLLQRLVSRGAWVGDGDVRIGALLGVLFPGYLLGVALGAAYIMGGAVGTVLLVTGAAHRGSRLPFVPFLFFGACVAAFAGPYVLAWYGIS